MKNIFEKLNKKMDIGYQDPESVIRLNQSELDNLISKGKTVDEAWEKVFGGIRYSIEVEADNKRIVEQAKEIYKQSRPGYK